MKIFAFLILICFVSIGVYGQAIIKTPRAASEGLYQAWNKKNRKTAEIYARQEAIDKLFGVRRRTMKFKGCTKREEGDFECIYLDKKIDLSMAMIVKIFRIGYRVVSVSFSSEAI